MADPAVATVNTSSLSVPLGHAGFLHQLDSCLEVLINACGGSLCRQELFAAVELIAFVATEYLEEKLGFVAGECDGEAVRHNHYFKVLFVKWGFEVFLQLTREHVSL